MKFQRRPFFTEQLLFQQYNKHRFALKLHQLDACGTPYLATPGWKPFLWKIRKHAILIKLPMLKKKHQSRRLKLQTSLKTQWRAFSSSQQSSLYKCTAATTQKSNECQTCNSWPSAHLLKYWAGQGQSSWEGVLTRWSWEASPSKGRAARPLDPFF